MPNYPKAAATAKRLIEAAGRPVKLYRANREPDDPAKPWLGSSAAATPGQGGLVVSGLRMAFVPPGGGLGGIFGRSANDARGNLQQDFEQVALLASDSAAAAGVTAETVEACDSVLDGAQLWKIVERAQLKPGDRSLLFALGLSR